MTGDGAEGSESVDDMYGEIWERESQPELSFPIKGVGSVSDMYSSSLTDI